MSFRNLSCLGTIICSINTIGIVPVYACKVCDAMVASCATTGYDHETKWAPHIKRENGAIVYYYFFSLAGPREKQVVFAIRAKLGLTPKWVLARTPMSLPPPPSLIPGA